MGEGFLGPRGAEDVKRKRKCTRRTGTDFGTVFDPAHTRLRPKTVPRIPGQTNHVLPLGPVLPYLGSPSPLPG